ncbi:hypothetical protein [Streptomyces microflavus]|uniref:DUF7701 domain-containing protein n=1 Tax=Streptomyces microflavus TaxID=1919 RepID=UPI002E373385|nr:hypothetical protein [Streptomyces microflavus]
MNYLQDDAELIRGLVREGVGIPDESDALFMLYAVLLRSKGVSVTRSDVHDAWSAWATLTQGSHKSIVPYGDLDASTKEEDEPFVEAIRLAASQREC